jgi:Tol biopolymer transport system component
MTNPASSLSRREFLHTATGITASCGLSSIAFGQTPTSSEKNFDLYVVNADGTGLKQVTNDPAWERQPAWSPDGSKIAFDVWPGGDVAKAELWVMNADGSGRVRLTAGKNADWSPDGKQIVYARFDGGVEGVFVMNADGSGVRRLVDWKGDEAGASWLPDGRIIFDYSEGDKNDVFQRCRYNLRILVGKQKLGRRPESGAHSVAIGQKARSNQGTYVKRTPEAGLCRHRQHTRHHTPSLD